MHSFQLEIIYISKNLKGIIFEFWKKRKKSRRFKKRQKLYKENRVTKFGTNKALTFVMKLELESVDLNYNTSLMLEKSDDYGL